MYLKLRKHVAGGTTPAYRGEVRRLLLAALALLALPLAGCVEIKRDNAPQQQTIGRPAAATTRRSRASTRRSSITAPISPGDLRAVHDPHERERRDPSAAVRPVGGHHRAEYGRDLERAVVRAEPGQCDRSRFGQCRLQHST